MHRDSHTRIIPEQAASIILIIFTAQYSTCTKEYSVEDRTIHSSGWVSGLFSSICHWSLMSSVRRRKEYSTL